MAYIKGKMLFFTTSPRTPIKMIPEIKLLNEKFEGQKWNNDTQERFMDELANSTFFEGSGSSSNKSFSARDRINRAPKALGFIDLTPTISLTPAGKELVYGKRPQEVFLRQLLKFQLPSPFHKENNQTEGVFFVRPYLEIIRLIRDLDCLSFDECKIFAVQLTSYHKYNDIKGKIVQFRKNKSIHKGEYKRFVNDTWTSAVKKIFFERIANGMTKTRETNKTDLNTFIKTQKSNMRDYADACFRYLRYTSLVSISHSNRSISIFADKVKDVDYILSTVDRNPVFIDDLDGYKEHLFASNTPALYTDNRDNIIDVILRISNHTKRELISLDIEALKDLRDEIVSEHKENVIRDKVEEIKSYALYSEIVDTYNEIISDDYFDAPLMLEYNTWRAMTMLDGGDIKGNFNFDDSGQPLSTAAGNMPDIECSYGDFSLSVEVTMQRGQRQYEMEGEPVARHYGQLKKRSGKETYCLFIAPKINPATLAHFYGLNHVSISLYGGKSKIIPLELDQFMKLVDNSYNYKSHPVPSDIRRFLDEAIALCDSATDENHWYSGIQECVNKWMRS